MRRTLALVLAVVGTGAVAGSLPVPGGRTPANQAVLEPIWAEAKWPFALDQWGVGRAFVCAPADCECDVVVALAVLGDGDPGVAEPAVMAFLNSNPMVLSAKKELGLEFVRRDW